MSVQDAPAKDILQIKTAVYAVGFAAIPLIMYNIEGFEEGIMAGFAVMIVLQVMDSLIR